MCLFPYLHPTAPYLHTDAYRERSAGDHPLYPAQSESAPRTPTSVDESSFSGGELGATPALTASATTSYSSAKTFMAMSGWPILYSSSANLRASHFRLIQDGPNPPPPIGPLPPALNPTVGQSIPLAPTDGNENDAACKVTPPPPPITGTAPLPAAVPAGATGA